MEFNLSNFTNMIQKQSDEISTFASKECSKAVKGLNQEATRLMGKVSKFAIENKNLLMVSGAATLFAYFAPLTFCASIALAAYIHFSTDGQVMNLFMSRNENKAPAHAA